MTEKAVTPVPSAQDVADAAVDWFEWHAAHPIDGGPHDVRDDVLYRVVAEYRRGQDNTDSSVPL